MRREFLPEKNLNLFQFIRKITLSVMMIGLCSATAVAWASKPTAEAVKPPVEEKKEAAKEKEPVSPSKEKEATPPASEKVVDESIKHLIDIDKGFTAIAESALPAVVNVATTQVVEMKDRGIDIPRGFPGVPEELFREFFDFERPRRVQSLGSGFIIRSNENAAFIVTNYHVIADAKKISIFLNDKTELEAGVNQFIEQQILTNKIEFSTKIVKIFCIKCV